MSKPKVIDITDVIFPMMEDWETVEHLTNSYREKYKSLLDEGCSKDESVYLICIHYLCKISKTDKFMIEGVIYYLNS